MLIVGLATYALFLSPLHHWPLNAEIYFAICNCDWALLAITLAEIINAPITEFPLSWLQQVQKKQKTILVLNNLETQFRA